MPAHVAALAVFASLLGASVAAGIILHALALPRWRGLRPYIFLPKSGPSETAHFTSPCGNARTHIDNLLRRP
jgi:hypothetical protein